MAAIPIMRPRLPRAERLAIYLNKIDEARVYSNFGPLTASLEERIASHFRLSDGAVATVANGTSGCGWRSWRKLHGRGRYACCRLGPSSPPCRQP
jgi:hypothetical protein